MPHSCSVGALVLEMKVSVITPTYNSSAFIENCIHNVASQGESVLEHIVVDGGSTDGTVDIIQSLQRKQPNLLLIPGPDEGQSDALNKGTAAAAAPIIGILNCDDTYQCNAVARAAKIFQTSPHLAFITGNCLIIEGDHRTMTKPKDLRLESLLLGPDLVRFPANPASYFYKKALHDSVGGYDVGDHYAMDFDFIIKCALRTQLHYVDEHWGNFDRHPGSKTFADPEAQRRVEAIIERYRPYLTGKQLKAQARLRKLKTLKAAVRKLRDRAFAR